MIWVVIVTVALFLPAGNVPSLPAPRRRDRARPRWHPGAGPVLLLPPDPAREGGRVLQLLPRDGPRHVLVRDGHASASSAITDSYRPAIFALIAFFVIGGLLLTRVDTERGIREAGNDLPAVI